MSHQPALFERYKRIKAKLDFTYQGYDVANIIAVDLISIIYGVLPFKITTFIKSFCSIDFKPLLSISGTDGQILVTSGDFNGRKDYYEIISYFRKNNGETAFFDMAAVKYKISFSLSLLFRVWKKVIFNSGIQLSIKQRIQLACVMLFRLNSARELDHLDLSIFKKYVAFSSVHPEEATFTHYFKKRGIRTYSLQHGIYHVFKDSKPMDVVAYENFNTDQHFCWGNYTRDEFIAYGIPANRLVVGGYPRELAFSSPMKLKKASGERLLVLLAREQFAASNQALILLLIDFIEENPTRKIDFKLHPSLDVETVQKMLGTEKRCEIIDSARTVSQLLSSRQYAMTISNNTSAYYESYIYGIPCLRYKHPSFSNGIGVLDDEFEYLSDLLQRYTAMRDIDPVAIQERLKYVCGVGENNYIISQ